jgi:tRNA A-37 threonylcarbamoyl transferase component Bud32
MGCVNSYCDPHYELQVSPYIITQVNPDHKPYSLNRLTPGIDSASPRPNQGSEDRTNSSLVANAFGKTFYKAIIQVKLQAIKDGKLKKRVSDILFPIHRKFFIHSIYGSIEDTYQVGEIIGQGSSSTVRRCVHIDTKIERAIKTIAKNSLSESQRLTLHEETEILKSLDHPNIVKIIEVVEDDTKLNIVTELCSGGELFEKLMTFSSFSEQTAAKIMYQLLSGLIHIHENSILHRDLKPENIMFSTEDDIKIIDFSIAVRKQNLQPNGKTNGTVLQT